MTWKRDLARASAAAFWAAASTVVVTVITTRLGLGAPGPVRPGHLLTAGTVDNG